MQQPKVGDLVLVVGSEGEGTELKLTDPQAAIITKIHTHEDGGDTVVNLTVFVDEDGPTHAGEVRMFQNKEAATEHLKGVSTKEGEQEPLVAYWNHG